MRPNIRPVPALICLLALFATTFALVDLSGCATPQKQVYQTLAAVGAAEDTAMKTAASARHAGKLTAAQWADISVKHAQFQAAYNAACDAAGVDLTKAISPDTVATLSSDVVNLVNTFTK